MAKITSIGAGSMFFVRSIIGDCMFMESLKDADLPIDKIIALRGDLFKAHGPTIPKYR